ncbi:hypothetical protein [Clostridium sp.]
MNKTFVKVNNHKWACYYSNHFLEDVVLRAASFYVKQLKYENIYSIIVL